MVESPVREERLPGPVSVQVTGSTAPPLRLTWKVVAPSPVLTGSVWGETLTTGPDAPLLPHPSVQMLQMTVTRIAEAVRMRTPLQTLGRKRDPDSMQPSIAHRRLMPAHTDRLLGRQACR